MSSQKSGSKDRRLRETELYGPIKVFLEGQGWDVKAEIGAVDVLACRDGDPPLIVELKVGFSLSLVYQAVDRQAVTDLVYIAVPRKTGKAFQTALKNMKKLCRRLGLGLMTVRLKDDLVEVHCDPGPFQPRKIKVKKARLLREFARRTGDPNIGGAARSAGLVTAYRQDAQVCAVYLFERGASKGAEIAKDTGVKEATRMMRDNHYGWFEPIERGVYGLTEAGAEAVGQAASTDGTTQ
ncbi:DUF2161 domain-containing phosphodiesterase [Boseongicola aestuarii]|nr:DUF2161 family putative PD-(D/E)XK-type phosphodiesterase [Boseongicola aestuarii]